MKEILKQTRLSIIIIILGIITWILMLPSLPDYIPMQFTMDGNATWEANKYVAAAIIIGLMIICYVLAVIKPIIDPEKNAYIFFKKYFLTSILAAEILIYLVGLFLMLSSMDSNINLINITMLLVGLIFIFTGNYLPKVPTTWFIGIRNPWSLTNKDVWNRTHRFTGILYILAGFLFILASLLGALNLAMIVILVALCIITPHVYSYIASNSVKS